MQEMLDKITIRQSARFIAITAIGAIAIPAFTKALIGIQRIESLTATASIAGLGALGAKGKLLVGTEPVQLLIQGKTILISELCTGLLEFAIVASAIAATKEIPWKKRALGILGALFGVFAFNQLRVIASVMQILTTDLFLADLTHNVLFRVFLFLAIAGMYWAWLNWATRW